MNCKDCIHYEVCGSTEQLTQYLTVCNLFKDKSRFVELPCKVGDTVYVNEFIPTDDCDGFFDVFDERVSRAEIDINEVKVFTFDRKFVREDFGKTVFLTYEEAKKKLEETKK